MTLFLQAYFEILAFERFLAWPNFRGLYQKVRACQPTARRATPDAVRTVCRSIDFACVWYPKPVLCLQRSAATTCLLRKQGVSASLVVGARQLPFKAHAWVEVEGRVVNDKPYMSEIYGVLDRC